MKSFFEKITTDNGNEATTDTSSHYQSPEQNTFSCSPNDWCRPDHFCSPCDDPPDSKAKTHNFFEKLTLAEVTEDKFAIENSRSCNPQECTPDDSDCGPEPCDPDASECHPDDCNPHEDVSDANKNGKTF